MNWNSPSLLKLDEPPLLFKHRQGVEDPRDGLTLFGPLDEGKPYGIRAGVIGTVAGRRRFRRWVEKVQSFITNDPPRVARPPFPGLEAAERMNVRWAQRLSSEPFLIEEEAQAAVPYQYEVNFHNQLKGRLLEHNAPTQIVRESTVAHREILNGAGYPTRRLDEMESAI